jgi:hypothetical protein
MKTYAHIAAPSSVLRGGSSPVEYEAEHCFQRMKQVMSSTPVLATLDFSKQFIIERDAFEFGSDTILRQDTLNLAASTVILQ